ncbi:MAG: hypothetical protein SGBAC_011427 [Bacillariaceae sp.]
MAAATTTNNNDSHKDYFVTPTSRGVLLLDQHPHRDEIESLLELSAGSSKTNNKETCPPKKPPMTSCNHGNLSRNNNLNNNYNSNLNSNSNLNNNYNLNSNSNLNNKSKQDYLQTIASLQQIRHQLQQEIVKTKSELQTAQAQQQLQHNKTAAVAATPGCSSSSSSSARGGGGSGGSSCGDGGSEQE